MVQTVVNSFSQIYTSTNSGATWSSTSSPSLWWSSVASSADGTKLVAGVGGVGDITGPIYKSSNSGATWTRTSAPIDAWSSLASSADGTKLVAGVGRGDITGLVYFSFDSGATWTPSSVPRDYWNFLAMSSDGTKCVAVVLNGGIYTSAPDQALSTLTSSDGRMVVAWSASAPGFRLQQNSDLTTTNWTDVTSAPTVTNLQNQLILVPAPTGNNFYRLKQL